jgi:hypothetical protein
VGSADPNLHCVHQSLPLTENNSKLLCSRANSRVGEWDRSPTMGKLQEPLDVRCYDTLSLPYTFLSLSLFPLSFISLHHHFFSSFHSIIFAHSLIKHKTQILNYYNLLFLMKFLKKKKPVDANNKTASFKETQLKPINKIGCNSI